MFEEGREGGRGRGGGAVCQYVSIVQAVSSVRTAGQGRAGDTETPQYFSISVKRQ